MSDKLFKYINQDYLSHVVHNKATIIIIEVAAAAAMIIE